MGSDLFGYFNFMEPPNRHAIMGNALFGIGRMSRVMTTEVGSNNIFWKAVLEFSYRNHFCQPLKMLRVLPKCYT